MSIESSWLIVFFKTSISLLIFFLLFPVPEREALKSLTEIVDLSISPFTSVSFLLHVYQSCY